MLTHAACAARLLFVCTARGTYDRASRADHVLIAQESRLQPDAPIWNGLITLAGRAGQLQRAFQVLEDMQASSCKPNARTFAALIDACSRAENTEMALRVYQVWGLPAL